MTPTGVWSERCQMDSRYGTNQLIQMPITHKLNKCMLNLDENLYQQEVQELNSLINIAAIFTNI